MANQVTGKNVIVSMLIDSTYYPIFCARSAELPIEQDEIELTHVNSGIAREYTPGLMNATCTISGVTVLDNSENRISNLYLMQQGIRRQINSFRMLLTDQDGDQQAITFSAFLRSALIAKEVTQWSRSDVTFRITGEINFGSPVNPPVQPACDIEDPLSFIMAEGANSITSPLLIPGVGETFTILWVDREGIGFTVIVGTPGHRQCTYNDTTGTITFDTNAPAAPGGEVIDIGYKIEV